MTVFKWSETPGPNDAADSSINLREGQAPSTVNNSVRAIMAAVKKWWLDLGGMIDTAGSGTAYTIATNQNLTVLTDGFQVSARLHATNGVAPTLAVDGLAAKNITVAPSTAPDAGMFLLGSVQTFVYDEGNTEWRVKGIFVPSGIAKTGDIKNKATSVTDPGWLKADGRTIGNAASGGVSRANADTEALFLQLWSDYANTLLPIQDSSGSPSTRGGDAATDYAANKRLPLPDLSGRVFAALDNMSGTSRDVVTATEADTLGSKFGAEKHALQTSEIPSHSHGNGTLAYDKTNSPTGTINAGGAGQTDGGSPTVNSNHTHFLAYTSTALTGSMASTGGGGAHNNMQPTFFGYVFIKL